MYIFFINDKPLVITSSEDIPTRFQHLPKIKFVNSLNLMDLVRKTEDANQDGMLIIFEDPATLLHQFKSNFTTISAGGGIVFNQKGELLIIKRLGKWDLPKGKIDPGETIAEGAIREVEEECGIDKLSIDKFLTISYHTYKLKGHRFLKATHWYLMKTSFVGQLTPQLEESITEVKWINLKDLDIQNLDTYESIREILVLVQDRN
jgi:8-oxo-dGTP pyrophosphatase MutT (NUDIX family)